MGKNIYIGAKQSVPIYDEAGTEIIGYEEKFAAQGITNLYLSSTKKVTNGWIKTSSGAKQFYPGLKTNSIIYSGNYTQSVIIIDRVAYDLFELTTSGSLTANIDEIWMCGGGGCGASGLNASTSGGGGGGGYIKAYSGPFSFYLYSVTIGAGCKPTGDFGGSTRIEDLTGTVSYAAAGGSKGLTTDGGDGGSGGGAGASDYSIGNTGAGEGISTYPFGVISLKAHCAGGGGGSTRFLKGRNGGTNGSDGSNSGTGAGGEYGGGKGGVYSSSSYDAENAKGSAGTFYGAGGGGGSAINSKGKTGGAGYQGVVYLLIKK